MVVCDSSSQAKELFRLFEERFGEQETDTSVLMAAAEPAMKYGKNEKPKLKETTKFFALESRAPGQPLPSGAIWASRTELAELELAQPAHRAGRERVGQHHHRRNDLRELFAIAAEQVAQTKLDRVRSKA